MSIYKSISLIMRNTFLITTLFLTAFAGNAQEKAASLILKETFGSDPYNKMAYHDGVLLVSGLTGVGSGDKSGTIDVLRYSDKGFDLLSQAPLISPKDDLPYWSILGLSYVNGYWVILAESAFGNYLTSATLTNEKLTIVSELRVGISNPMAQLVSGNSGNLYVVSGDWSSVDPKSGMSVIHFNIEDNGAIKHNSAVNFGIRPNEPDYRVHFSVSYDNHALYLTSNQDDTPAGLYKLPLADDGSPQAVVELTLKNAKSKYYVSKMSGDLWLLSYENWGFQVAQLKGDALQVIFEHESNSWYNALEVKGNLIFGLDTFGDVDVFQIGHDKTISHRFSLTPSDYGFNRDMLIADDTLFITQGSEGISALKIEDNTTLTNLHSFSQSGVIGDIAMHGNELAVATFNHNLYFWGMGDTDPASLNTTYHGGYSVQGVVWEGDEMVINDSAQLESHLVENLKNNINVGTRHGSLGSQGSDGQIIKLKNGYAAVAFGQLSFIDESKNIMSTITSPLGSYTDKVGMVASEHVLFVPMGYPSEVAVYDTSDLSNVTELTRIKRNYAIYSNVAVKDNYLYIPVALENGRFAITPYNISNPAEPVELPSVEVGRSTATATLHIDGNYLIAIGSQGALLDISVPEKPAMVDENLDISTNGIGAGFENDLFTVPMNSAGRLQRSCINFAPQQGDLTLNLDEDGQTMTALSPSDNENDSVTFSILDEPTKGTVTIQDNISLSYVGAGNANGTDTAKLLVTDAHGGASEFNLTINIKPINDAPLFNDQPVTLLVGLGQTKRVALDVTDVDGDKLTFEITDQATLGSADVDSQGVVTYAPNTSTAGTDSFVVMVSDAVGVTARKKVNVTISTQPVATTPIATGNSNDSSGGTVSWFYLVGLLLVGMQRRYTL
ncbi:hypothetical protein BGP78_16995 [Pseudoalteromonas sp. MSK9-3]|uniref:Ig-like domain-containing protein n=1 Tax=Pseudoalteromonas sp. MSK9-3 TaxID=1897633 RepID=UPI000E6D1607|nr:Ig-like domain-containing protein [Pseudoalteromonas sp. MSK9-3]RJE73674.1 hypothetical protein BGP78_16995 [Pseudoalteromonas sp. MSK9-3]